MYLTDAQIEYFNWKLQHIVALFKSQVPVVQIEHIINIATPRHYERWDGLLTEFQSAIDEWVEQQFPSIQYEKVNWRSEGF